MKKIILPLFLFLSFISFAQEEDQDPKKHELTMNALTLIASEWIDVSYEYLIDQESSFGVDLQFGLDSDANADGFRKFSLTPNYRRYFSGKYAKGFFVEAFGMIHTYEEYVFIDLFTVSELKTNTDFSLGISVGGKWVTPKGFVTEIFLGVGRNLFNNDSEYNFSDVAGRVGVSLGYRF